MTIERLGAGRLGTIEAWHEAVNAGAAERTGALCTADVEVGGPRGSGHGRDLLIDRVRHAGIRMKPVRWFCGSGGAVVEQDARWADATTGELGAPTRVATAFGFADDRISRVLRHPDVASALAVFGLGPGDEVRQRRNAPDAGILPE
jgi:SnoaL-like domain